MFNDSRSKKLILISHCILNQNSISDGTADYPGAFEEVVNCLIEKKVGIIQLPCPELMCLGLDRGDVNGSERTVVVENTRIRKELLQDNRKEMIKMLVNSIVFQVEEYIRNGFNIYGVVGINRSPSCGINTTSKNNKEVEGEGVFINALRAELESKDIKLEMVGIKSSKPNEAINKISNLLLISEI